MKSGLIYLLFFFIAPLASLRTQTGDRPVVVHALIGDTLDLSERDRYQLFPLMEGFRYAVFYLNPDSTLHAKVSAIQDGAPMVVDIPKYRTLESLRTYISRYTLKSSASMDKVYLTNGTVLVGVIAEKNKDVLRIRTSTVGMATVAIEDIEKIEGTSQTAEEFQYGMTPDPNITRTFLMPTAQTLPAGGGYVGDYELLLFTLAWAPVEHLMLNGGFILLPIPLEYQVLNFGFKVGLGKVEKNLEIGLGAQFLKIPETDLVGMGYAVASFGNENRKLNVGAGFGFDLADGSTSEPVFGLSGDLRASSYVKFLAEIWVFPGSEFVPFMIGVRFFGSHLSADLGLMYPMGEEIDSPIGIPVLNFIYNF